MFARVVQTFAPTRCLSRMFTQGIDTSPPIVSALISLDRATFHKTIPVLAVRVVPAKTGLFLKSNVMRGTLLHLPKIKNVVSDEAKPDERLVLLGTLEEAHLAADVHDFVTREGLGLTRHTLELDYSYWTTDEILDAILPPGLPEGTPTSFSTAGHLAHVNLRDEYLPYKHIIGQVILDKNPNIRTVVNKLSNIHAQFRFFEMELIAGEPDYLVEVSESDCRFTFDFTTVYWNSRLHHEHERLVSLFKPGEVIADAFAGVGPFALPAAKRGCVVFANDLNPESVKWMKQNVERNHVEDRIRVSCEDGASFIKSVVKQAWDDPFPDLGQFKSASQRAREARRQRQTGRPSPLEKGTRRISHFAMNLPDSAITFLGAFRGLFSELHTRPDFEAAYGEPPMVHCYCFTRELEPDRAQEDIRERASNALGHPLSGETIHHVRRVAPNKDMYCLSFRLPKEVIL